MSNDPLSLQESYLKIVGKIQAAARASGRDPRELSLVAVSKGQPITKIAELYGLGQRDFGENYAQELITKHQMLKPHSEGIAWHFLGHLQTNKVKAVLPLIRVLHSLDSLKLAHEIRKHWLSQKLPRPLSVFVEVNIGMEASKSGLHPSQVTAFVREVAQLEGMELLGLMTIADPQKDPLAQFKGLSDLEKQCRPYTKGYLSMGMSSDFPAAITQGATHVRVGTSLFGARPART